MPHRIVLHVLGSAQLTPPVALTAMQRAILAAIALQHPHPTTIADLTAQVWAEDPPASARAALQNQISRLRAALPGPALETGPDGYRWNGRVDVTELEHTLRAAETSLTSGHPDKAFALTDRVLAAITGPAFSDLPESTRVVAARNEADARQYALENLRLTAAIADGHREWAVVEAERLTRMSPYDEQRHALSAQALLAAGRSAEGLRVISSFRRLLRDELGLVSTELISETERAILHGGADPGRMPQNGTALGRDSELSSLLDHLDSGKNVTVCGEPGIGVSTLLSMLVSRMSRDDWTVALIRHTPMFDAEPLEVLGEILTFLDAPTLEPWQLLSQFSRSVDVARGGKRLLMVVDDADHLGPSTMHALREAAQTPGIALVTGAHTRPSGDQHDPVMVLEGLSHESIAELLTESYHTSASVERVERLHQATAGNPLLLHALLGDGDKSDRATNTERVREIVHTRLARLSPAARRALDWLAVSDGTIPSEVLALAQPEVIGIGEADPELIVMPALTFRHNAVREVVYYDLPDARRTELHHALATLAQEHGLNSSVVARHALASATVDPLRALAAARAAAGDSSSVGAHLDAAAILAQAIEVLPDDLPEHLELRIARGDALRLAGDPSHLPLLHEAAGNALAHGRLDSLSSAMFALLQLGATSGVGQVDEHTQQLTRHALTTLTAPEQLAVVLGATSLSLSMGGRADEALASFRQAEQLATDRTTRDAVLPFAYLALGHPDYHEQRAQFSDELVASGRAHGNPYPLWEGLHQRFSHNLLHGDRAVMQTAHDEMVALMPRLGDVGRTWSVRYQEAALAHLDGEDERAEQLAFDAYRIFAPVSEARASSALHGQILGIRLTQNRTAELADALRAMIAGQPSVPAWHAALAHATASTEPEEAREQLCLALDRAQHDFTWLATHVVGARAAAALGDAEFAARFLELLAPYSGLTAWQGTCTYGPVDTALALAALTIGDPRATEYIDQAGLVAERLGSPDYVREAGGLG